MADLPAVNITLGEETLDIVLLNNLMQLPFAHECGGQIQTSKLDLPRALLPRNG